MINLIVAIDSNNGMGNEGKLLYHLPKDLKRFKEYTQGQIIIMGRKTFESLPIKPLPNRESIIITRDKEYSFKGCNIVNDIENAVICARKLATDKGIQEIFVIGGAEIYKQFLEKKLIDRAFITYIEASLKADTFFPDLGNDFKEVNVLKENDNGYETRFCVFERI